MKSPSPENLIYTVPERCRVCYTCVRDCPAKAIRIHGGQAEVISERCIGCGNCVQVCRQNAKQVRSSIQLVSELLKSGGKIAAIIAPSFPADFPDIQPQILTGMVRLLGFDLVCEVAFGADLVAAEYRKWIDAGGSDRRIATTCPAVVSYVEKYHPSLVSHLSPIVSPMIAEARALHKIHGNDLKIVFIGPCFAKKNEVFRDSERQDLNAVLTFKELRQMFADHSVKPDIAETSEFDPPYPGKGVLFPVSRGMLQTAGLRDDLLAGEAIVADGKGKFVHALKEFESGALETRLLEVLCCNGCIMGPGMSLSLPYFTRRTAVSQYARESLKKSTIQIWNAGENLPGNLDLTTRFEPHDNRLSLPSKEDLDAILERLGKFNPEDELDCGACGYETCREHALAIYKGLAENEMCLPYTIERLKRSLHDLHISNEQLASAQQALISAEKLASMGQLSAGIAHEINNPLGVILLYSKIMLENSDPDSEQHEDLQMIVEQAERCKTIVSGLLNFARKNKVNLVPVNFPELIDRCLKGIIAPENIMISVDHQLADPTVEMDADQIIQVLTNLLINAIEAMPHGGKISISTFSYDSEISIRVSDTGTGIPDKILPKIFEPLFTTKQIGKGTGLGLAVTYGIVKMHRGRIEVQSNADEAKGPTGTTFVVSLPRKASNQFLPEN